MPDLESLEIAVLVPCYNEAPTIAAVVRDFKAALPHAVIYVYDNGSNDGTADVARAAGACVRQEMSRGKGHVVRRMFADIEADVYLLVDGDGTYDAKSAPALLAALLEGRHDLVNARRVETAAAAYRAGHRFGNRLLTGLVARIFGTATKDMLSGYKAFSHRYVKSFPAHARGFEIETELMIHALELRMSIGEIDSPYAERTLGSTSKLRTLPDGLRILNIIGLFCKEERPLPFFGITGLVLALASLQLGIPLIIEFSITGLVPRLPTAVLASGVMLTAMMAVFTGLILDTVTRGRREAKRLAYLALPAPGRRPARHANAAVAPASNVRVEQALSDLGQIWTDAVKKSA
jgi:glycosyltransferase involved in cell wall biosynthesis